jgi:hypothetical protein
MGCERERDAEARRWEARTDAMVLGCVAFFMAPYGILRLHQLDSHRRATNGAKTRGVTRTRDEDSEL